MSRFDPGLLVDRDVWLFFLAGVALLTGSSAAVVWGVPYLQTLAAAHGALVWAPALVVAPGLLLAWVLGAGFTGFPFLESEWHLWRSFLSLGLGLALLAGYGLGVAPALGASARAVGWGVAAGVGGSLVLYTGLSKLRFTLPARGARD